LQYFSGTAYALLDFLCLNPTNFSFGKALDDVNEYTIDQTEHPTKPTRATAIIGKAAIFADRFRSIFGRRFHQVFCSSLRINVSGVAVIDNQVRSHSVSLWFNFKNG